MKRAKKRMLPILAKLIASTRRAVRALKEANAVVSATNQKIARRRRDLYSTPVTLPNGISIKALIEEGRD